MKEYRGIYLPDIEQHLCEHIHPKHKRYEELPDGRATYQRFKYKRGLQFVKDPEVFVDVGAHVGLWSMQAEFDFERIIAFEPCPEHLEIYPHNMRKNFYTLHPVALGSSAGSVGLGFEAHSTGGTHISGDGDIEMRTLDSFEIDRIDLMKIDVEGFEYDVVVGGRETIERCQPIIILEQKGRDASNHGREKNEALNYLRKLGMRELCAPYSGDYFLGF